MKSQIIKLNKNFVGRVFEKGRLKDIACSKEASVIVVHGRRRVGKTELLEQSFRTRNILKFEGIEGQNQTAQIRAVLHQLAIYRKEPHLAKLVLDRWTDVFELIGKYIQNGVWTLYFEEVQWLASYQDQFVAELKYVWDNLLRYNSQLILILCGSSPSFMIDRVLQSGALYNRSQHEIALQEFRLDEIKMFLGKNRSNQEVLDAYLSVGGIPEYLKYLKRESSVFLSLCKNSFTTGGFFANEYERVFTSSLARNGDYRKIIEFLSQRRFASRNEILSHLRADSGGTVSKLLTDLELCGFIDRYTPFHTGKGSRLARYCIQDCYLQFYFKFIQPVAKDIRNGDFNKNPTTALRSDSYYQWLGYAFERVCRRQHRFLAKILGFESVEYQSGAFFNQATKRGHPGFQLDLVYDRADRVYTLVEIKYLRHPVTQSAIAEFEKKLSLFPNPRGQTIQKALVTASGANRALKESGYFDNIITLDDFFL